MDAPVKIVTQLPLRNLWQDNSFTTSARSRFLNKDDIASLLRSGYVQFVVADIGTSPCWIQLEDCYRFWKDEVKPHLASAGSRVALDGVPDGYCYFASAWDSGDRAAPIVVLEKHH